MSFPAPAATALPSHGHWADVLKVTIFATFVLKYFLFVFDLSNDFTGF